MVEQETVLEPCIKCGKIPNIRKEYGDIYYAQCHCGKWNTYEFLATSRKNAINRWNEGNRPIVRKGNPRNEKHIIE